MNTNPQAELRLIGEVPKPKPAPDSIVAQIATEVEAVRVSLIGKKASWVAEVIGVSPAYLSMVRSGARPFPDARVTAFCAATGTLLLQQYRDLQAALRSIRGNSADDREAALAKELRAA